MEKVLKNIREIRQAVTGILPEYDITNTTYAFDQSRLVGQLLKTREIFEEKLLAIETMIDGQGKDFDGIEKVFDETAEIRKAVIDIQQDYYLLCDDGTLHQARFAAQLLEFGKRVEEPLVVIEGLIGQNIVNGAPWDITGHQEPPLWKEAKRNRLDVRKREKTVFEHRLLVRNLSSSSNSFTRKLTLREAIYEKTNIQPELVSTDNERKCQGQGCHAKRPNRLNLMPNRFNRTTSKPHGNPGQGTISFHRKDDMEKVLKVCNGLKVNGKKIYLTRMSNEKEATENGKMHHELPSQNKNPHKLGGFLDTKQY
mgnify:CR=1 FL=1